MIKKGWYYCCNCQKISNEIWFKIGNTFVQLKKKTGNNWIITQSIPNKKLLDKQVYINKNIFTEVPRSIRVEGLDDEISQTRVCPHCLKRGQESRYFTFLGEVPLYIIPILGPTYSGKSSYLKSLFSENGQHKLTRAIPGAIVKHVCEENVGATQISQPGDTLCYIIRIYEHGIAKLDILFRDTPGEVFNNEHALRTPEFYDHMKVFRNDKFSPGADAVLMLADDSTTIFSEKLSEGYTRSLAIDEVLSSTVPFDLPFALVLTKSDKYMQLIHDEGALVGLDANVLLNRASDYLFKDNMNLEELEYSKPIVRKIFPEFGKYIRAISVQRTNWMGFFSSNGTLDYTNELDTSRAFGLTNAILYLLAEIGIYRYPDEDEF